MIRLDTIRKQNGHQILFIEASAALYRGEKVGLVGPNGAGKTTLFRMIIGQELSDEGQVAVDRGVTIGYFSSPWVNAIQVDGVERMHAHAPRALPLR